MRTAATVRRLSAVLLVIACAAACSLPPEQMIVGDFFAASRLRDTTALSRFATVVFEPREEGTVTRFAIVAVSPEQRSGNMRAKDVTVSAPVRLPDGRVLQKRLQLTLQKPARADAERAAGQSVLYDGWIVTAVEDLPADRPTPRS